MRNELTRILGLYKAAPCFDMKKNDYLFRKEDGTRRDPTSYYKVFSRILYDLGIKGAHTHDFSRGPCINSLRHVFVMHSLLKAEAEGRSFMDTVPFLSTYLGHERLMDTDKYMRARYDLYKASHAKIEEYTQGIFPEVDQPWPEK